MGVISLVLILQRWDSFVHSLSWFFSTEGAIVFVLTLLVIKIIHELGHALMLRHHGLSVPTMGVAFMVMWPVLYTDATNAWRLPHRRDKAIISAAGVITELVLACYAMLAWLFLPEGLAKSVAFTIATTTWVLSLVVNLNPLMRFDGYFFLSDMLNVPNLQERSFAMARWQLRRWLFGYEVPPPEKVTSRMRSTLVTFGISVWVYRFFLFLGIALLVYHLFFKVLGVLLFLVEIWYFIARPIRNELAQWREIVPAMKGRRRTFWIVGLAGVLLLLIFPFRQNVVLPAHVVDEQFYRIYPPERAQVLETLVQDGDRVEAGQVLMRLASPDIGHQLEIASRQATIVRMQLAGTLASDERLAERLVLEQALQQALEQQEALSRTQDNLVIRAPFDGQVVDTAPDLAGGRWVAPNFHLLTVRSRSGLRVQAWARESELAGLEAGRAGRFYAAPGLDFPVTDLRVDEIETSPLAELDVPYHASIFGGDVPVVRNGEGRLVPAESLYRIHLLPEAASAPLLQQRIKGYVYLEGERRSLLARFFTVVAGTLVREAGF